MLQRKSLTVQVIVLVGFLIAPLMGAAAYECLLAFHRVQSANKTVEVADAARSTFLALQNTRVERGPLRSALRAAAPGSAVLIETNARARAIANPALDALEQACRRILCASGDDVSRLTAARRALDTLRPDADAAVRLPLPQRPQKIADRFNTAITGLVDLLEEFNTTLTLDVRSTTAANATLVQIKDTAYAIRDIAGLERDYMLTWVERGRLEPAETTEFAEMRARISAIWPLLLGIAENAPPATRDTIMAAKTAYFDTYIPLRVALEKAIAEGRAPTLDSAGVNRAIDDMTGSLVNVADTALVSIGVRAREEGAAARLNLMVMAGMMLVVVLISVGAVVFVRRNILRPLLVLCAALRKLAGRDYGFTLPDLMRGDEVGEMSRAVEECRSGLVAADAMAEAQRDEQAGQLARAVKVDAMVRAFEAETSVSLGAVGEAAANLDGTAVEMKDMAEDGSKRAVAVAAAAKEASANVQTAAAAAEELSASIAEVARQVTESATVARRAADEARATNETVANLSAAAHRIGEVVQMISQIAGQTNLLALNATIEAARAGDAGKGFAVVASEVKGLATQTARATNEIGLQIAAIQHETTNTVKAIDAISQTIAVMDASTNSVAAAAEQQAAATREIGRAMVEAASGTQDASKHAAGVSQDAERTGRAAIQVRDASGDLSHQADELRRRVNGFLTDIRAA